jgi:glycosyltransferase involved in cell wall biosynthesis
MKIAYITAGAAGMFCGSCMHDNTLVAALTRLGHDALLIPTYTPIRTDEKDVSQKRIFFGGINVYLQQKLGLFRHTPWIFDRLLDAPGLLSWAGRFAAKTQAEEVGDLVLSMLNGEHGFQRKEVDKLAYWLSTEVRPELVNLTNALLSGMVHEVKARVKAPILCTLQGDDIFLEALPEPIRSQALDLIRAHCQQIDGFITTSAYYADFMTSYLGIPPERLHVVYPGLNLTGHGGSRTQANGPPYTVGYFARICPEKGLHNLAEAFQRLRQRPGAPPCRLRVSGWLGEKDRPYFDGVQKRLYDQGLGNSFEYVSAPDQASKVRFLQSLDVLSVPTTYREPKGLYVLEALANGVPVIQPRHGSFPELVQATGGGLLVNPNDPDDLADKMHELLTDKAGREEMGHRGQEAVRQQFNAEIMARHTLDVYRKYL